jgi:putative phage-type endonuclease
MEVFELPLDACTHLTHRIKAICRDRGYHYKNYKAQVHRLLATDLGKVWARRRSIHRVLRDYGKADQRTDAWHAKRSEMITASEVTKAFAAATPSGKRELLLRKLEGPKVEGGGPIGACLWGTQFEPLAKKIYGDMQGGAEIVDTSCVQHPFHRFLGASPDGIVLTKDPLDYRWGKLVEFKCPISRPFTQNSPIPDAYYHQMQMQMECCNVDECDYVEMQFKTVPKSVWNDSESPYKGVMAVYDNGTIEHMDDEADFVSWKSSLAGDEFRVMFWILNNIRIENVPRDPLWMKTHLDELKAFWAIVEECRKDPTKIDQYAPPTAPRDGPSATPEVAHERPAPADGSSAARTTTLRLQLSDYTETDQ